MMPTGRCYLFHIYATNRPMDTVFVLCQGMEEAIQIAGEYLNIQDGDDVAVKVITDPIIVSPAAVQSDTTLGDVVRARQQ